MTDVSRLIPSPSGPQEYDVVCLRCGLRYMHRALALTDRLETVPVDDGSMAQVIHADHMDLDDCLALLRIEAQRLIEQGNRLATLSRAAKIQYDAVTARHNALVEEKEKGKRQ